MPIKVFVGPTGGNPGAGTSISLGTNAPLTSIQMGPTTKGGNGLVRRQSFIINSPTMDVSFTKLFDQGRPVGMRISEFCYGAQTQAGSMTVVVGEFAKHYDPYGRKCTRFIPLANVIGVRVWSESSEIDSDIAEYHSENAQIRVYVDNTLQPSLINDDTPLYLTIDFIY